MTTEERALLELRAGDLRRSIRNQRRGIQLQDLGVFLLYAFAIGLTAHKNDDPLEPIFIFLASGVVAYTAAAQAEKNMSQKIEMLLEIEEIKEKIRNEK